MPISYLSLSWKAVHAFRWEIKMNWCTCIKYQTPVVLVNLTCHTENETNTYIQYKKEKKRKFDSQEKWRILMPICLRLSQVPKLLIKQSKFSVEMPKTILKVVIYFGYLNQAKLTSDAKLLISLYWLYFSQQL